MKEFPSNQNKRILPSQIQNIPPIQNRGLSQDKKENFLKSNERIQSNKNKRIWPSEIGRILPIQNRGFDQDKKKRIRSNQNKRIRLIKSRSEYNNNNKS